MTTFKRRAIVVVVVLLLGGVTGATQLIRSANDATLEAHGFPVAGLDEPRRLAGWADEIFFGEVIAQDRQARVGRLPVTLFRVRVGEVLKGTLAGEIVVDQLVYLRRGRLEPIVTGDTALVPGKAYLFATRTETSRGIPSWRTPAAIHGNVLVSNDSHRALLRTTFLRALERPIPYPRAGTSSRDAG